MFRAAFPSARWLISWNISQMAEIPEQLDDQSISPSRTALATAAARSETPSFA